MASRHYAPFREPDTCGEGAARDMDGAVLRYRRTARPEAAARLRALGVPR